MFTDVKRFSRDISLNSISPPPSSKAPGESSSLNISMLSILLFSSSFFLEAEFLIVPEKLSNSYSFTEL